MTEPLGRLPGSVWTGTAEKIAYMIEEAIQVGKQMLADEWPEESPGDWQNGPDPTDPDGPKRDNPHERI